LISENQTADRVIKVDYILSKVKMDVLFGAARKRSDREVSEEFVKRQLENAYMEYLLFSPRENSGLDSTIVPRRGSTQLIPKGNNKKKLSTIAVKAEKAIKHGQAAIDGKRMAKLPKTLDNAFDQLLKKLTLPLPGARDDNRDQELMRILSWSFNGDVDRLEELLERIANYQNNLADAVAAVQELIPVLKTSASELISLRKQTISPRDTGNTQVNDLIASLLRLYKEITGREIATIVGAEGSDTEGIAGGPVIKCLKILLAPLELDTDEHGISTGEDALRARVREVMDTKSRALG
tara:strand:+ start:3578 stop:4462 length:885 start_codon:yes stop_codon:yes gene_type:complete